MTASRKPLPALTGIRGIAALWVVLYHMQDAAKHDPHFAPLAASRLLREGFRGVDLFFLLSGFILFYVHADDFRRLTFPATRAYAIARIRRVYPLNAAVLLMIVALACALPDFQNPDGFTAPAIVQSLLLAQRWLMPDFGAINGPSWSLSVEIIGYAAFPLLAWSLNRTRSPTIHLLAAGLCLAGLVAASRRLGFADANITGRLAILRMFPAFIAGAALAACMLAGAAPVRRHAAALAIVSGLAIPLFCATPATAVLTIFPVAGLVLALAYEQGPINSLLASAPIVWLGRISFSLYLTHFTVLGLLVWLNIQTSARWPYMAAVLATIIGVGALVHYVVEKPSARIVRRRKPALLF